MTKEQKKRLVLFHHALWCFAKELPVEECSVVDIIFTFRNEINPLLKGLTENEYSRAVEKESIKLAAEMNSVY